MLVLLKRKFPAVQSRIDPRIMFHIKRNFVIFLTLLVVLQIAKSQNDQPSGSEEEDDDDSSSEETIEESDEAEQRRRRRRSAETVEDTGVEAKSNRAIPGLPDPAAILKIAEILTTVGQEVLPLLVQGNSISNFLTDRIDRDVKFVKSLRNDVDLMGLKLKRK